MMAMYKAVTEGAQEAYTRTMDKIMRSLELTERFLNGDKATIKQIAEFELHLVVHDIALRIAKEEANPEKESPYTNKAANEIVEELVLKSKYATLAPVSKVLAEIYGLSL